MWAHWKQCCNLTGVRQILQETHLESIRKWLHCLTLSLVMAGEMARSLRTLTALSQDSGSSPRTHLGAHSFLERQHQMIWCLLLASLDMCGSHIYVHEVKVNLSNKQAKPRSDGPFSLVLATVWASTCYTNKISFLLLLPEAELHPDPSQGRDTPLLAPATSE